VLISYYGLKSVAHAIFAQIVEEIRVDT
jgi:hypothetical protein